MTKLKLGNRELNIKYSYEATAKSGIIKKFAVFSNAYETEEEMYDRVEEIMKLLPEMILVGAQKFHREEFWYDYETGEGKEEALSKIYALIDDYFDEEGAEFDGMLELLQKEMLENGFLAKMFRAETEKEAGKNQKK